jgi:hypothetical protein
MLAIIVSFLSSLGIAETYPFLPGRTVVSGELPDTVPKRISGHSAPYFWNIYRILLVHKIAHFSRFVNAVRQVSLFSFLISLYVTKMQRQF